MNLTDVALAEIVDFLHARVDDDEAAAKAVAPLSHVYDMGGTRLDEAFSHSRVRYASEDGRSWLEPDRAAGGHFARHDPARVLREVEAKRAIIGGEDDGLALYVVHERGVWPDELTRAAEQVLRHMAAVDSDHPDYRQEWAL